MELKTFVQSSIVAIIEGVKEAQATYPEDVNPGSSGTRPKDLHISNAGRRLTDIDFDVAVTVSTEGATQADGRIEILNIVKLGAGGSSKDATQSVSRLKFSVPVSMPGGNC